MIINPLGAPIGKITSINVQDNALQKQFIASVSNGVITWANGVSPTVTPGAKNLSISFGVQNQGLVTGNLTLSIIDGITGNTLNTILSTNNPPGSYTNLQWNAGTMPPNPYPIILTVTP